MVHVLLDLVCHLSKQEAFLFGVSNRSRFLEAANDFRGYSLANLPDKVDGASEKDLKRRREPVEAIF